MDELKAMGEAAKTTIGKQTNVQINEDPSMGGGNYGKLIKQIMRDD